MDKNSINISAIEDFFYSVLYKSVSSNLFFGGLPSTIDSNWNDAVVVDCSTNIDDLNAYGYGVIPILLYATKNNHNGTKNIPVLSKLEKLLNEAISKNKNPKYSIKRLKTYSEFDTTYKLYYNVVLINTIIL